MAEPTTSRRLYPERPLSGDQESQEREAVVDELLELIERAEPKHKLTVIGLYGERGSGKTSVLYGLLDPKKKERREALKLLLPQAPSAEEMIFDPGLARDERELPFDLLAFLQRFGTEDATGLKSAVEAVAKMDDPERYLDLAKDLVPSALRLPEEIANLRVGLSAADKTLHNSLKEWGGRVTRGEDRRLLLLLDDVDLCPDLAYPLLDWVTRYLRDVPCVAVLCADEPTLLSAIEQAMKKPKSLPELARPLLAKLVPLAAYVTPWSGSRAARLLLDGEGDVKTAIDRRSERYIGGIMFALRESEQKLDAAVAHRKPEWSDNTEDQWSWLISHLAPRNPRRLKGLHNRLAQHRLLTDSDVYAAPFVKRWTELRTWIVEEALRLIFVFVLMVDQAHPQLGLWHRVVTTDVSLLSSSPQTRNPRFRLVLSRSRILGYSKGEWPGASIVGV